MILIIYSPSSENSPLCECVCEFSLALSLSLFLSLTSNFIYYDFSSFGLTSSLSEFHLLHIILFFSFNRSPRATYYFIENISNHISNRFILSISSRFVIVISSVSEFGEFCANIQIVFRRRTSKMNAVSTQRSRQYIHRERGCMECQNHIFRLSSMHLRFQLKFTN